ncbi:MAG: ABC transporter ATP-binding protein [Dehalococcoidia bacterium]|nr:ABC transporter ATP-binding protein [Dehalococcoidia bacterium]
MTAGNGNAAIALTDVSRWYGNVVAVNDVSFELPPGIHGLLGPNGAGKSTILHMLAGFLQPSQGEVRVLGQPAWRNVALYRDLGLVQERESVYPFQTGYDFVLTSARLHGLADPDAATRNAIAQVQLEDAADRATGGYSKGMRQRIKVAAAMVHDPQVLLLDEPFNGMDPRQRIHMMGLLREMAEAGKTIVFSSHILEEVERLAENVLVIVAGRLAASGDFRQIRRLMTDRPHTVTVRSSDNRALASALASDESVQGLEFADGVLTVRTGELSAFALAAPRLAKERDIRLMELRPTDESLESVFSYLVSR